MCGFLLCFCFCVAFTLPRTFLSPPPAWTKGKKLRVVPLPFRFVEVTPGEARANLECIASFAPNFLPTLFNILGAAPQVLSSPLHNVLSGFLSVTPTKVVTGQFTAVMQKLLSCTKKSERSKPESVAQARLFLAVLADFVPHLKVKSVRTLLRAITPYLTEVGEDKFLSLSRVLARLSDLFQFALSRRSASSHCTQFQLSHTHEQSTHMTATSRLLCSLIFSFSFFFVASLYIDLCFLSCAIHIHTHTLSLFLSVFRALTHLSVRSTTVSRRRHTQCSSRSSRITPTMSWRTLTCCAISSCKLLHSAALSASV
jgi:hypothetical protein